MPPFVLKGRHIHLWLFTYGIPLWPITPFAPGERSSVAEVRGEESPCEFDLTQCILRTERLRCSPGSLLDSAVQMLGWAQTSG